jgi:thiol-disulfide isomerase/thioredoxin
MPQPESIHMKSNVELYIEPAAPQHSASSFQVEMFNKIIALLLFLLVIVAVLFVIDDQQIQALPDNLEFQRIDGVKQTFAEFKGKPLLVTFWSPSCAPCLQEVEHLNRLYSENQGGEKFELLALSMYYDRPDWVIETSRQAGMTYPVYFDLQKFLSRAFGNVTTTPSCFLLDREGKVIFQHIGVPDFSELDGTLRQLIRS